jgi:hypothetical protein
VGKSKGEQMTKEEVLKAANVMIAYANGKNVGTRPTRSMEPLLKILYVPTWNWEQKEYCVIPDDCSKESLEQSEGGKAVSDTLRTDKVLYSVDVCDGEDVVNIEFARTIERELNSANTIIRQQQLLEEENLRLQDRIKRLEETGDYLDECILSVYGNNHPAKQAWRKAKESKP